MTEGNARISQKDQSPSRCGLKITTGGGQSTDTLQRLGLNQTGDFSQIIAILTRDTLSVTTKLGCYLYRDNKCLPKVST